MNSAPSHGGEEEGKGRPRLKGVLAEKTCGRKEGDEEDGNEATDEDRLLVVCGIFAITCS